jgi:hypothetical protein
VAALPPHPHPSTPPGDDLRFLSSWRRLHLSQSCMALPGNLPRAVSSTPVGSLWPGQRGRSSWWDWPSESCLGQCKCFTVGKAWPMGDRIMGPEHGTHSLRTGVCAQGPGKPPRAPRVWWSRQGGTLLGVALLAPSCRQGRKAGWVGLFVLSAAKAAGVDRGAGSLGDQVTRVPRGWGTAVHCGVEQRQARPAGRKPAMHGRSVISNLGPPAPSLFSTPPLPTTLLPKGS